MIKSGGSNGQMVSAAVAMAALRNYAKIDAN
jgi:hypothetical protein